jgi:hypothetical protein
MTCGNKEKIQVTNYWLVDKNMAILAPNKRCRSCGFCNLFLSAYLFAILNTTFIAYYLGIKKAARKEFHAAFAFLQIIYLKPIFLRIIAIGQKPVKAD